MPEEFFILIELSKAPVSNHTTFCTYVPIIPQSSQFLLSFLILDSVSFETIIVGILKYFCNFASICIRYCPIYSVIFFRWVIRPVVIVLNEVFYLLGNRFSIKVGVCPNDLGHISIFGLIWFSYFSSSFIKNILLLLDT